MKWVNTEINKEIASKFRVYLKERNIKYETSEVGNLIHFECYMNQPMIVKANEFLRRIEEWITEQ